jgi:DNA-binding CsgD family transcriptional regulator
MNRVDVLARVGETIAAIHQPGLPAAVAALLRSVAPYSYTVIFGFHGTARPLDLFDDFPAARRKIFVTDYQEGPYLLDPFYKAATQPVPSGLYRMRDLAPDRFYQGEYFRNYYIQTGLAEEIGFFVTLPEAATVVLSLMRAEKPFSGRDLRNLSELVPVVEACLHLHWADLAKRFAAAGDGPGRKPAETGIVRSFQTFGAGVLTPREREIAEHTLKGHSAEATGKILAISPGTVRIHRRNIYAKLRISSQGELFSRFIQTLGPLETGEGPDRALPQRLPAGSTGD